MDKKVPRLRKQAIVGLRKSVEFVIDKPWPDDETKSKLYSLLSHIGRTGQPIEEHLIVGHEPAQADRPAGELPLSGRACRAAVIRGTRIAIKSALDRNLPEDLRAALCKLRRRIGASGPVPDDVLGLAPDSVAPVPLEIGTGEYDRANAGLRNSIEFLESQPWLPASARSIIESVLQAIGRRPVGVLVDSLPETEALAWESICGWVRHKRRDCAGMLRMARRAWELLTGSWPWGSSWVETQRPPAAWVDDLLGRDARVVLDYAPLTKCPCPACVSRREERENAHNKFYLGELRVAR